MEELEARADTKDEKALQLEAEAFTLLDANKVAEASLKGQQAKSLREAASTLRQKAVILYQQRPGELCCGFALGFASLLVSHCDHVRTRM